MNGSKEIPYGYCQCGCGERTKVDVYGSKARGIAPGTPRRMIWGHSTKKETYVKGTVPKVGDIADGPTIGKKGKNNKYFYGACAGCGVTKWVPWNKPKVVYCLSCANKMQVNNSGRFAQEEKHHLWKGGRFYTRKGYVYTKVNIDSPYISMAKFFGQNFPYILEHRLVVAESLGRPLETSEVIHHMNGIKDDNRIDNLAVVTANTHNTRSYIEQLQDRIRELEGVIL